MKIVEMLKKHELYSQNLTEWEVCLMEDAFKAGLQEAADILYMNSLLEATSPIDAWRKIVDLLEEE